ncbi:MAG: hypothetical protein HKN12_07290, partial [Gemmatimonadetes bacterium]|nr:hypothetical protein [Gemmatimonadota bacterium]
NEDSRSQSAYLVSGMVSVDASQDMDGSMGLAAGYSLYSGDKASDPDDMAYDNLYYDDHRFHGAMDLAQGLSQAAGTFSGTTGAGLKDLGFKGWVKSESGLGLKGAVHFFSTHVDVPVANGDRNSLGREIDVVLFKDLESGMSAQIGGGFFSPGNVTEDILGDESAAWIYAQGTTSF